MRLLHLSLAAASAVYCTLGFVFSCMNSESLRVFYLYRKRGNYCHSVIKYLFSLNCLHYSVWLCIWLCNSKLTTANLKCLTEAVSALLWSYVSAVSEILEPDWSDLSAAAWHLIHIMSVCFSAPIVFLQSCRDVLRSFGSLHWCWSSCDLILSPWTLNFELCRRSIPMWFLPCLVRHTLLYSSDFMS